MFLNPITWPEGKRSAACVTFDIDADSLIRTARPDDAELRLQPISMGRYGPTVAMPRILDTYRRFGLTQTFFMPAWVMQTYPDTVEAILKDGHEIGHHSWMHEDPMMHSDDVEAELFERALEVHVSMTGRKPRGYRAPVYSMTPAMVDRLIEHEFLYDSSMMADDLPYLVETPKGSLIEIPPHWGTDDWPPFAHFGEIDYLMPVRAPSDGIRAFAEEFDAMHDAGGFWMPVLHPFLTGRVARWREMEKLIERALDTGEVWFAPMEQIASHAQSNRDGLRQERIGDAD
ncbi:polysaccharide deacetylase [Thalassovita sp.]|uniref:polysaccharide deacetylase family protein n=1 Tax=Thalassovita sp. TaxID=1979401 RepID=UPI002B27B727|nr:polysaccharide deacetylase [Thalassovita sp.]